MTFASRFCLLSETLHECQARLNVACGWGLNVLNALISRAETRFANRDGNGMLHVRWKNMGDKEIEMGGTGSR
jgi:hypothetical protein